MYSLNSIISAVVIMLISYLIGSVNFSIMLSRIVGGKDIRESGSGNAGATNMLRTYGKKMGVITLLLDVLKGIICILIAKLIVSKLNIETDIPAAYIAGVCVVIGHNFPLYFGFKGGKGVATSLGVVLMIDWKIGLIVAVISVAIIALTRYVSLGSIIGGIVFMAAEIIKMFFDSDFEPIKLICIIIIGGLLILRHHQNIKRLITGTENKLGSKTK